MRRIAAAILMVLILTSCAPKVATPVTSGFSCMVDVIYDETTYCGTLEVPHDGAVELVLCEPSTVAGLTLSFVDDRLTASFAGMELALSDTQVPAAAVVRLLKETLDQAAKQAAIAPSNQLQGELDGVEYTFVFDRESGLPLSLSVPAFALSMTYSDWKNTV